MIGLATSSNSFCLASNSSFSAADSCPAMPRSPESASQAWPCPQSGHVQDAIRINVECDLDLRHSAQRRRYPIQAELAQQIVVFGQCTLAFEDLDEHAGLIVGVSRELLGLLRGYSRVPLDELRHDAARGPAPVTGLAHQDGGLHRGAEGDGLVGVDGFAELLAHEELLDHRLDLR
eukprot:CAMPEP_0177498082 /NCGR_PEP_ID=MMETSP0369-20130122/35388_1 /TAXON_ID=447022 ORGANISM="Scrippsiella hangoei-like, Strain SHHI-4" /NCGR_SAMPLE_ID=MMETSP0369 /ASSEMBLY_ACC=CAM_ASM_000364 /LENGTH=175 /DNA_ID=CAMNT_0018975271 /DNA_START=107 /DNA_END=633 /DNA_ORIENTATION=+